MDQDKPKRSRLYEAPSRPYPLRGTMSRAHARFRFGCGEHHMLLGWTHVGGADWLLSCAVHMAKCQGGGCFRTEVAAIQSIPCGLVHRV